MAQRIQYAELSPEAMAAMRSVEHHLNTASGLAGALLELVRLRASLLNGCEYCIGLHTHELKKRHEPESRVAGVAAWRDSDAFTQRERAALAWTEAVTNIQVGHASDKDFAEVREHFTDKEVVDLTVAVASINAWNRVAISFRAEKRRASPPQTADGSANQAKQPDSESKASADDDGGKVSVEEG